MICIPVQTPNHKDDHLVIVLDVDNFIRMGQADPAEVKCKELGKQLVNPRIMITHEKMTPDFEKLLKTGDVRKIVEFLSRGFKFLPHLGDSDEKPKSILKGK
jgi:hypothetical protein